MVTSFQSNNMNNILPTLLKKTLEHVALSITFREPTMVNHLVACGECFLQTYVQILVKRLQGFLVGIEQHPLPHGGVIGNNGFLHFSNIFHPSSSWWMINLKIDPRDKTECSRFARKVMYNNFESKKKITTMEHYFLNFLEFVQILAYTCETLQLSSPRPQPPHRLSPPLLRP